MAKAIKWQIPFQTNDPASPTSYRIDIYAEGYTGNPIQLTAGPQPIVTEENKSDDFFTPVRSQTGTIQVCTRMPNGGLLDINDLLPADNIAHPVRLVSIAANNAETIEWQGFMSCEAFSQAYTEVSEIFSFPVNSVLEAMASVYISGVVSLNQINVIIYTALNNIEIASGMTQSNALWQYIYYSASAYRIFQKKVVGSVLFEEDEIQAQHSLTYTLQGISCKDVIERLCKFMGWTAREKGKDIYLEAIGETIGMYKDALGNFRYAFQTNATFVSLTTANMSEQTWMGVSHKKSLLQGTKRVEVVAKLDRDDLSLGLPDFPFDNPTSPFGQSTMGPYNGHLTTLYPWLVAEQNDAYYNICTYHYGVGEILPYSSTSYDWITNGYTESTRADFLSHAYLKAGGISGTTKYTGAALVQFSITHLSWGGYRKNERGLYCTLVPNLLTAYPQPIFTIRSVKQFLAPSGTTARLKVSAKCYFIGYDRTNNRAIITDDIQDEFLNIQYARYAPIVRFGQQYYSSGWHAWQGYSSASGADGEFVKGGFEIYIPLNGGENGDIEIGLPPNYGIDNRDTNTLFEVIFTELSVEMECSDDVLWRDSDENRYITLLSTNFRDEISVDVDFASSNNNRPCMSHIYEPTYGLMKTLDYSTSAQDPTQVETRRPESDLLNRLAAYYGAARQRLELEVAHPTAAPLPLLKLNGINDGKVYLPLSEKRDWKEEVCTLICFETPN